MKKRDNYNLSSKLAGIVPFFVLIFFCGGFFIAITTFVPSFLEENIPKGSKLPEIMKVLYFSLHYPIPTVFLFFTAGCIVLVFGPKDKPLQITALYIGCAFIVSLWITFLVLIPQTFCHVESPFL